eukprot:6411290-Pyramimonas_sp.AAC.1
MCARGENALVSTPVGNDSEIQVSQERCFVCAPHGLANLDESMVMRDAPTCRTVVRVRRPLVFHPLRNRGVTRASDEGRFARA